MENRICIYEVVNGENGVGKLKETTVLAFNEKQIINDPYSANDFFRDVIGIHEYYEEHVYMLMLNNACEVIGISEVSHGTYDYSACNPREVYSKALMIGATRIIVAHNHPSNSGFSKDDINTARKLKKAGEIVGIEIVDFMVIKRDTYNSCYEEGVY